MLDPKDFSFFENQNNFDFKGFLIKILSYWKWFLASLIVCFVIAYQVNIRKEKIYGMESLIAIREESNPFFTSNTSLVFNWGGTSDKVQTIITTLKSRSHNEIVVAKLEYYIKYFKQGKYNLIDAYGEAPFKVVIDKSKGQLSGIPIKIKFLNASEYELSIAFENESVNIINYYNDSQSQIAVAIGDYSKRFKVGEQVKLPYLNWKLELKPDASSYAGKEYFVRFDNFNSVVSQYQGISVDSDTKGSSILKLAMQGTNKARMVDYLNTTVEVLRKNQLDSKNQFAINTIAFIDSTLIKMEDQLKGTEGQLKDFRRGKNVLELEDGGEKISEKLAGLDIEKDAINRKIAYYNTLRSYLNNSVDYSKLPAPAVAGIDDPNIVGNVSRLIALSIQRSEKAYAVKNDRFFRDFDNEMESVKKVLLENIAAAKTVIQNDLALVNAKMGQAESTIKRLPDDQQDLLKITRKYDLAESIFNTFLAKRNEANIVKAANLSDIHFIDSAKDTGGGLIGPKTSVNYVLALFLGLMIPLVVVFIITFMDNSIHTVEDIAKLTKIPLLGVIGKKKMASNLAVFEKPKSALAESFRAVRSSLQFLYKKQNVSGAKTLMLTSSISGEGKTFCSINIATVFALSEKKTVIVGLDLRKPKIFGDFDLDNSFGVVNYLIGQKTADEIIQKTRISYLDVITSGPIPPNPAELILGESMKDLLDDLKRKYDYIILDTPPVGLVSDALELAQFCDATLYVVRQNVTKKGMLALVNDKHKRGELTNISIVFNGYESKARYGYGYGYGYGDYSNGYHDEGEPENRFKRLLNKWLKK
ncbi:MULTISPECIES: polysaccharide biosynthesis tyrosine autokinase [Flavobacterium]|jgi:capsular exopolysaccharide synthesis family protein|uniref:non-specific protein-tyrosine kinase n=2 Tax=Flavobacterium TaxID=237 RepID=A0A497UCF1_9FLAO|nr:MULTISPECIES: tyrosine-protein kinase family protein [Flavobacterium]THD31502.1 MAG: polysaccharide biosynthesis tyrosine autokinase [Flavobacterium johnsoniae]MBL7866536.1 polysaccharide biosynthesis tyrosine autokinase [Flavobacterium lindanitolerans]OJX49502.1 MAG: sugar transporter [Flavobacterium sp. 38-13]PKW20314.1 protein involved in gliding motility EpsB [Flavobacterium lindanitolerans]RLJ23729.1 capsular exopolysaccharide synthesis family protein [Flavobacterium lindanitolerans]